MDNASTTLPPTWGEVFTVRGCYEIYGVRPIFIMDKNWVDKYVRFDNAEEIGSLRGQDDNAPLYPLYRMTRDGKWLLFYTTPENAWFRPIHFGPLNPST